MNRCLKRCVLVGVGLLAFAGAGRAEGFRFPVRLTYLHSLTEVSDWYKDHHIPNADIDYDLPLAVSFTPFFEFDFGLQIFGDLGPVSIISGNVDYYNVPVGFGIGYAVIPWANHTPYVRTGVRYPIAGGDHVAKKGAGIILATGYEFLRRERVGIQVEIGYDTSKVELEAYRNNREKIRGGFTVSAGAVF